MTISPQRRQEIIDALRRGTVPSNGLDALATGLERFDEVLEQELQGVKVGGAVFKAVRGEYGCGKTFFARWLAERAQKLGFATSEVQVSETETPLHRLETVYRRLMERLATAETPQGALRNILDGWFYALEEDVLAEGTYQPERQQADPGSYQRTSGAAAGEGDCHGSNVQRRAAGLPRGPGRRRPGYGGRYRGLAGRTTQCGRRCEAGSRGQGGHRPLRRLELRSRAA